MRGGRRSFEEGTGDEAPVVGRRRRRMTLRGRVTIGLPLAAAAASAWMAGPGRAELQAASRWLEPPAELRLARVDAPPAKRPWAPQEVFARLPVSYPAFRAALGSVDWAQGPLQPGTRLWEQVPVPPDRDDLVAPLRVQYTFDADLTQRVFGLLAQDHVDLGNVLVLDPSTDEVLVYASTDVNRFPPTSTYPAASLIKLVTTAAALETAPESLDRPCRFDGSPYLLTRRRVDPPRRGTEVSLVKALAMSNNQCFAQLAVHEVGATGLLDVIRRFGFLESPAPAHAAGQAVDPGGDPFELGRLGCGLAGCRITPLHAAELASVVADGEMHPPHWVARVVDGSGHDLSVPDPGEPRHVIPPALAARMRRMMVHTTTEGTARRAFQPGGRPLIPGIDIAGKTGSLSGQNPDGRYEWFIGLAPAEHPRVAVVVVVVQGQVWHKSAVQVSAQVFQTLFCTEGGCAPSALGRWMPPRTREETPLQSAMSETGG